MGEEDKEGSARGGEMEEEEGSHPCTMPSSTSSPESDSIDDFLLEEFPAATVGTVGIRDGLVGSLLGAGVGFLEPITGRRLAELVFNCSATSLAGLHRFLMSGILLFFTPMFSLFIMLELPGLPSPMLLLTKLSFFALLAFKDSFRLVGLLMHFEEPSYPWLGLTDSLT